MVTHKMLRSPLDFLKTHQHFCKFTKINTKLKCKKMEYYSKIISVIIFVKQCVLNTICILIQKNCALQIIFVFVFVPQEKICATLLSIAVYCFPNHFLGN